MMVRNDIEIGYGRVRGKCALIKSQAAGGSACISCGRAELTERGEIENLNPEPLTLRTVISDSDFFASPFVLG